MSIKNLVISLASAALFLSGAAVVSAYSGNGNLTVYVQVTNSAYAPSRLPADFTVSVHNAIASPTSFPGSLSGTNVVVSGQYSVSVLPMQGYAASYSQGCAGSLWNNDTALCTVTMSPSHYANAPYSYYPNQYYPYYPHNSGYVAPLTCAPQNQLVTIGQSITFTATGGEFSQFNWSLSAVPNSTKYNIGRTFTTTLNSPGAQSVTVFNGSQSATCNVTVVGYPVPGYSYNYPNGLPVVTVTPTFIPRFPNTGFAPVTAAGIAFAAVLLIAAYVLLYSHVRRAFASIWSA